MDQIDKPVTSGGPECSHTKSDNTSLTNINKIKDAQQTRLVSIIVGEMEPKDWELTSSK